MLADIEAEVERFIDAGDLASAASAAIRGYGPQILGYLSAVLRDPDDADEAFGRFSENLWNGIAAFRRDSSIKTWAYKLAWHAALRVIEDPFRRRAERLGSTQAAEIAAEVRSSTSSHLGDEAKARMAKLREQLAPDEQTMIILRFDRGLTWREVAAVLATAGDPVDEAALRKRFERLKEKLRKLALDFGIGSV